MQPEDHIVQPALKQFKQFRTCFPFERQSFLHGAYKLALHHSKKRFELLLLPQLNAVFSKPPISFRPMNAGRIIPSAKRMFRAQITLALKLELFSNSAAYLTFWSYSSSHIQFF